MFVVVIVASKCKVMLLIDGHRSGIKSRSMALFLTALTPKL
jgi:hypothetical protein